MAEVQNTTRSGENAARFIEFVRMQTQNASLFLGLIPHPSSGEPEVNLDLARMFIDQLAMIQEKTRGNLSSEETNVLRNALSNLQMAFYEVTQEGGGRTAVPSAPQPAEDVLEPAADPEPSGRTETAAAPPAAPAPGADAAGESKKRFTKSYGS